MARSTFYYHKKRFNSTDKYFQQKEILSAIFHKNKGRYGYRRITATIRNQGFRINHKTVYKLMQELELKCLVRKKRYHSYKGEVGRIAENVLARNFKAEKPNQKWATDVTEFSLFGTKLYLSPIIDLYNGEIISFNLAYHPTLEQTMDMLNKAFIKIPDNTNLILHSDQGWQYQHKNYRYCLKQKVLYKVCPEKGIV